MYKLSRYNYFVSDENQVIYLNGITSKIFAMSCEEHLRLQMFFQNLDLFEQKYPSVFKLFRKWGFIIFDSIDEVEILKYRNRKAVFNDKHYMLVINPTLECNFNCWYCYEEHPRGFMANETMHRVKKHIKYMIEKEKITSFNLSWFGGEPLLYFKEIIYPISLYAKELCEINQIPYYCGATTNSFLIDKSMIKDMNQINMFNFQITLDGDEDRHDKIRNVVGQPTFRKIVDNINLLLEKVSNVKIILRINYDQQTLEKCNLGEVFKLFNEKYRNKIRVDFQRVWQTAPSINGENNKLLELHNLCIRLGYNQTEISGAFNLNMVYTCYADRFYHTELNYDGKVYRCTARGYSDEYVVGDLMDSGVIHWNEEKMARRYGKSTFENRVCLACKYLPLCCGPCSQKMIETSEQKLEEVCYLNYAEVRPETMILNYYNDLCFH